MRSPQSKQVGLTLSEVLISISLLALMLVTTLLLFTQLLASTTKNGYLEVASVTCDRVLEQVVAGAASSPPAFPNILTGEEELMVESHANPTKFVYRVDATPMAEASSGGERWLLEVEVKWWTDDPNASDSIRNGYGQLKTKQSRLVYIKW